MLLVRYAALLRSIQEAPEVLVVLAAYKFVFKASASLTLSTSYSTTRMGCGAAAL